MPKVALFGAAGAIGQSIGAALSSKGEPYRVVGRTEASLRKTFGADRLAEIVTWTGATLPIKAGWMSLSGLTKNGASGTLSGVDNATTPCLSGGNLAGVMVPTIPGYVGSTAPLSDMTAPSLSRKPDCGREIERQRQRHRENDRVSVCESECE